MRKITLFLFVAPGFVLSQNLKKDSLEKILLFAKDTTEIRILNQLSEATRLDEPKLALVYAQKANALAQRTGSVRGAIKAIRNIGYAYQNDNDFPNSTEYFLKSMEMAEKAGDLTTAADNCISIAFNYYEIENLEKVLKYDIKALSIYEKLANKKGVANATSGIAIVYAMEKKTDLALDYFLKSSAYFEAIGDQVNIAFVSVNIGNVYNDKKDYQRALNYFTTALDIFKSKGRKRGVGRVLQSIGGTYLLTGDTAKALSALTESLAFRDEAGDAAGIVSCLIELSGIYQIKKENNKALDYLVRALPYAKKLKLHESLAKIYRRLAEIYHSRGDFKTAYTYHELYAIHDDSALHSEKSRQIKEMQARFEIAQKEREIEALKKDKQISGIYFVVVTGSSVALLIIFFLVLSRGQLKRKKDKELADKERLIMETELEKQEVIKTNLLSTIEYNNKALTSYTLNLVHKNEMLEDIKTKITAVKHSPESEMPAKLNSLLKSVNFGIRLDEDWENFNSHFKQVNQGFLEKLKGKYPDLSTNDLRLCSLIKLNLETKQIASLMGISNESTKVARSRVRKKLGLTIDQNLQEFLNAL